MLCDVDRPCVAEELLEHLEASDITTQERVYNEFAEATRRTMGRQPLADALKAFERIAALKSVPLAYRLTLLLRQYPCDPAVIKASQRIATNTNALNGAPLVASLLYLERHDPPSFVVYFEGRRHLAIPTDVRMFMSSSKPVLAAKGEYISRTISEYLAFRSHDVTESARKALVAEGPDVAHWIVANYENRANQPLPVGLTWLLGEIGASESASLLLGDYIAYPNMRTAISIGSCLDDDAIARMFNLKYWSSELSLRECLKAIYGDRWAKVDNLGLDQVRIDMTKGMRETRTDCQRRSIPQYE